ncbi:hypothetical protein [Calycomorphotria hydatis]|uniref:Uncharacterized protein n=1 Tax=Calycomorphotria hydatis TaxID=2528027 RepID=A0A517TCV5_9PLAN|nr:hypothetical protein [Calycomorphotria hydatis]QDT66210.1 hypothetical protein V22_34750 [Calycomorphotria hydatis]
MVQKCLPTLSAVILCGFVYLGTAEAEDIAPAPYTAGDMMPGRVTQEMIARELIHKRATRIAEARISRIEQRKALGISVARPTIVSGPHSQSLNRYIVGSWQPIYPPVYIAPAPVLSR